MKKNIFGFIFISLNILIFISCASGPDTPNAQATIQGTIKKTIFLLEEKEYERIFNEIVHPDDLASFKEDGASIPDMAQQFGGEAADFLYSILIYIEDKEPIYKEQGMIAVFDMSDYNTEDSFQPEPVFEKLNDLWYIRD